MGSEDSEEKVMVRSFEGLLEMLFSADHGSVKRYKSDQTIELYDFEYDGNSKLRNDFKDLLKIREGALCFVKRFCENSLVGCHPLGQDDGFRCDLPFGNGNPSVGLKSVRKLVFLCQ